MKSVLVLLLLCLQVHAFAEFEFVTGNNYYDIRNYYTTISIGTPAQEVPFIIALDNNSKGLTAVNGTYEIQGQDVNGFNPKASSTWNQTGFYDQIDGLTGVDKFSIPDSEWANNSVHQIQFNVAANSRVMDRSTLPLGRSTSDRNNSFLEELLKDAKDKVAVLAFNDYPNVNGYEVTGKLSVGSYPDNCANWVKVPEPQNVSSTDTDWKAKVDKVTVGKFSASDPGVARFDIHETNFQLPSDIYDQVTKLFNVNNDYTMPCDEKREIVINIGDLEVRIGPNYYMWQESVPDFCYFVGGFGSTIMLPLEIIGRKCLMMDYENKLIGFGDLVN